MRTIKYLFFFSVCAVFILSCASVARRDMLYVNLTDSARFVLLPPCGIEHNMDMAQFMSFEFSGQYHFINAWVIANENGIDMALFNELGASIGELSYRNGEVLFSSAIFPVSVIRSFRPEYVIADFQLSFFDPILLGNSLKDSGLVLEAKDGSRRILSGGELLIEIRKTSNTVNLVNHLRGYSYTVEGDFYWIQ